MRRVSSIQFSPSLRVVETNRHCRSYLVSGAGQGGSSICTHDIPDGVEDTIEVGSKGFAYLSLVCTGDICS